MTNQSLSNPIFDPKVDVENIPSNHKFSPSQLNVWDECLKKGYYVYVRGFRGELKGSSFAKLGTIIHRMLALHYMGIPTANFPDLNEEFPTFDEQMMVLEGLGLVYRYENFYESREKDWNILGVEQYMCVPYTTPAGAKIYLNGFIDLIAETPQGLLVIDHKSGGRFWTGDEVYFDRQLMIYAYMLHLQGYTPDIIIINNINTTPSIVKNIARQPADKVFSRVSVRLKPARLEGYMKMVGHNIDRILQTSHYTYSTSKSCSSCYFKEACAMEFEGISPETYLKSNFSSEGKRKITFNVKGIY